MKCFDNVASEFLGNKEDEVPINYTGFSKCALIKSNISKNTFVT